MDSPAIVRCKLDGSNCQILFYTNLLDTNWDIGKLIFNLNFNSNCLIYITSTGIWIYSIKEFDFLKEKDLKLSIEADCLFENSNNEILLGIKQILYLSETQLLLLIKNGYLFINNFFTNFF